MKTKRGEKIKVFLCSDDNVHSGGYYSLAKGMTEAGFEVILGGAQTPREIAQAAIQEDVNLIAYRIMCADPHTLVKKLFKILKGEKGDFPIIVGGIIPPKQIPELKKLGVLEIFVPGSSLTAITNAIKCIIDDEGN